MSETKKDQIPTLEKYGISFLSLVNASDPEAFEAAWETAVSVAIALRDLYDGYSSSGNVVDEFRKSSRVVDSKSAKETATQIYQQMTEVLVESGALDDPATLHHLGKLFGNFNRSVDSMIEHHLSRKLAFTSEENMPTNRKDILADYSSIRETLVTMSGMLGLKVDGKPLAEVLKPRTGNPSASTEIYRPARFYNYQWTVDGVAFAAETKWWVVAQALNFQIFALDGSVIHYSSFEEFLDEKFGINFSDGLDGLFGLESTHLVSIERIK